MSTNWAEVRFLTWLIEVCAYRDARPLPGSRYVAIAPKMFTFAIVTGSMFDYLSVADGWCYDTYDQAKAALDAWDGQGEPKGWRRHPGSGRRMSQSDNERDDNGNRVAAGMLYRRA